MKEKPKLIYPKTKGIQSKSHKKGHTVMSEKIKTLKIELENPPDGKRLEEECKTLYGEETDIKKRYEILKRAFFAAHNSGYNDAMAWELSTGGSPSTHFWQQAIDLKWEVEKLCEYYELEVEED